uniref:ATP receptor n=1 Tax=Plectus sambesii TaxID=2011161 RepID=A0A914V0W2_9BILA
MVGDDAFCDPSVPTSCVKGQAVQNGNGVKTGNCVKSLHPIPGKPHTNYTCEIEAWCPVEYDSTEFKGPLLREAENFTLLVKNFIQFPKFGKTRRNILDSVNNETYLKSCHYSADSDPYCPIFQLGYIAEQSNVNFAHIAEQGGVIGVMIKWDCNLDFDIEYCRPQYSFSRLDSDDVKVAVGWNFRFSKEYRENGTISRDLYKAFGILFVFSVQGTAGKFSAMPLAINIGSGVALLGLATLFCDFLILHIVPQKMYYTQKKYLRVVGASSAERSAESTDEQVLVE